MSNITEGTVDVQMPSKFAEDEIAIKFAGQPEWYSASANLNEHLRPGNRVKIEFDTPSPKVRKITRVKVLDTDHTMATPDVAKVKAAVEGMNAREMRIEYGQAVQRAITVTRLLLDYDALPLGQKKKDREEVVVLAIDRLTHHFYTDGQDQGAVRRIAQQLADGEEIPDGAFDPDS